MSRFEHTLRTPQYSEQRIGHHKSLEWNVFSVELNVCICKCVFVQAYLFLVRFFRLKYSVYEDDSQAN